MNAISQWGAPVVVGITAFGLCFPAFAEDTYKVGIEGFYDKYREPSDSVDLTSRTAYGSVTGSGSYGWDDYLATLEVRVSYGKGDYKSISNSATSVPQYETEERLLGGMKVPVDSGYVLIPYFGLGSRLYYDKGKGVSSNSASPHESFDSHILQFYVPLGASLQITDDNWIYTPTLEFDQLLYGNISMGGIPTYSNITTTQMMRGYGVRGDFMVGQKHTSYGWEAGPFFRYWNIRDSKTAFDPSGAAWAEPQNTRVQAGASVKFSF